MSPEERDEKLLQEYLSGDSALSRLYRLGAREKPDARLDANILAAARRPPSRKSGVAHSPFARHWVVPTSLAAMVVLSVSVVLLIPDPGDEPTLHMDDAARQAPAQAPITNAPADAGRAEQQPVPARAPLSAQPGERRDQALEAETRSGEESASEFAPRQPAMGAQDADRARDKSESKRKAPAAPGKSLGATQVLPQALPRASSVGEVAEPAASDSARELLAPPLPRPAPPASIQDEPQAWLGFIEGLLDKRDEPGARSNLRAFMNRYPDVPLPSRIAELAASLPTTPP